MKNKSAVWMFLIGLGSATQFHFVGSLGVSELPIFIVAPFIFLKDYNQLKRDGFMPFIWLCILTCCGCVVSAYFNHTPLVFFLKGMAHPYALFGATVVIHRLLRGNYGSFKWLLIGSFISGIISIFILQQETFTFEGGYNAEGEEAISRVINNPLFWSTKIRGLITLPVTAFYLQTPLLYSILVLVASVFVSLFLSEGGSGRGAALVMLGSCLLILMGRKRRSLMKKMGRHVLLIAIITAFIFGMFKVIYARAAKDGYLGYEAQEKYMHQTRMGDSALSILMAGRMEVFCGLLACFDHPIIGFGPKGEDRNGYVENYLRKYGTRDDVDTYLRHVNGIRRREGDVYLPIPAHSHIVMFWISYGIIGLALWLYVIYLLYAYYRRWSWAVPQWYGYVSIAATATFWSILFNPFSSRIGIPLLICCILYSKAIASKHLVLPVEMELEAGKYGS